MSLPLSDRPFIGDALAYHRRDQQIDAAGNPFDRCPECGVALPDGYCDECQAFATDPNDTDEILAGDFDLAGEHGINEVW